jgi:hypothetical protein
LYHIRETSSPKEFHVFWSHVFQELLLLGVTGNNLLDWQCKRSGTATPGLLLCWWQVFEHHSEHIASFYSMS